MIKPNMLKSGDRIAIVSLSSGMLGEDYCSHNLAIGTKRMEEFGLTPVFMPNALKGEDYLALRGEPGGPGPGKTGGGLKESVSG